MIRKLSFPGIFLLVACSSLFSVNAQSPIAEISVHAGDILRTNTPASFNLKDELIKENQSFILKYNAEGSEKEIYCQLEKGSPNRLWWIISDTLHPGKTRNYTLFAIPKNSSNLVKSIKNKKEVIISVQDKDVLQYNYTTVYPPKGIDTIYKRSGFIHPLWSPSGNVLTRIQPPDHYHHYGIWNPWTKTKYEGKEIDFWNLNKGEGTVEHKAFSSLTSGDVFGGFRAELDHIDMKAEEGTRVVLNEEWDVKVWGIKGIWLWDFHSSLECPSNSPFLIEEYRYAGFGYRALEEWTKNNSYVITSEGKTRKDADGSRGRWCNVYGELGTGHGGIVFMSYPENQSHPEPLRIWPENANGNRGDMFFNFCPTKESDWELKPGKSYTLKYRMLVYNGNISPEEAERYWQDFAHPPTIEIKHLKNP